MRRVTYSASLVIALAFVLALPTLGAARIEFIDTGTPKSGGLEMIGWRGFIVRARIDDMPITGFDFGDADPRAGFIFGNMAQRWTDPSGQGNYSVTSPGPHPANNTGTSDFNFDTHFLGTPEMYTVLSVGEASLAGFFPSRTGLPSNSFVAYGATLPATETEPILYTQGGHLAGRFDIKPEFQQRSVDVAYIVADGPVQVFGLLLSGTNVYQVEGTIPEPHTGLVILGTLVGALLRHRGKPKQRTSTHIEQLEKRFQLSVLAPTGITAAHSPAESGTRPRIRSAPRSR